MFGYTWLNGLPGRIHSKPLSCSTPPRFPVSSLEKSVSELVWRVYKHTLEGHSMSLVDSRLSSARSASMLSIFGSIAINWSSDSTSEDWETSATEALGLDEEPSATSGDSCRLLDAVGVRARGGVRAVMGSPPAAAALLTLRAIELPDGVDRHLLWLSLSARPLQKI